MLTLWGPLLYCGAIYYYFRRPGILLQLSDFLVLVLVLIPILSLVSAWGAARFRRHLIQQAA